MILLNLTKKMLYADRSKRPTIKDLLNVFPKKDIELSLLTPEYLPSISQDLLYRIWDIQNSEYPMIGNSYEILKFKRIVDKKKGGSFGDIDDAYIQISTEELYENETNGKIKQRYREYILNGFVKLKTFSLSRKHR